jgi:AraC-like DNA-binding protein
VVFGEAQPEPGAKQLRLLRTDLARSVGEPSNRLSPRFERYLEAVLVHTGYHFETTRSHLEAGLERLVEPLLASGALDEKSFDDVCAVLEREEQSAGTVSALVAPYRRAVAEVERALESPTAARQDRSMRRALEFMREHLSDPLTRAQVARVAGFAPGHFSRLLVNQEGKAFNRYVQEIRVTRAKQMLAATSLSIEQVGQLSGFPSRTYFHRAFKAAARLTPVQYRNQHGLGATRS